MKYINKIEEICPKTKYLTLLIGSGVNNQACRNKITPLTNWNKLLDKIFNIKSECHSQNLIIDFERRLVDLTSCQNEMTSQEIQNERLKILCDLIKKEQLNPKYFNNYPNYLIKNKFVSDIVSLNFDLIPELILSNYKVPKISKRKNKNHKYKSSNIDRYREIDGIRFWHPHGDVQNKESILLGMRQYINSLKFIELMRREYKLSERTNNSEDVTTWYDALVKNTVIVLGSSLSENELDIWGALINRERNYAKANIRKEHRPPIYILWSECNGEKFNKPNWIKPLFPVNICYQEQWNMLRKLFEEHSNN